MVVLKTYTIRNDSGNLSLGSSSYKTILNGDVGIGTNDPREKLDVDGALHIRGTFATTYNNDPAKLGDYTNTYISFAPLGSVNDWAYLRQIGGTNLIHMVLDFHDDDNDSRFSIRSVKSAGGSHTTKTRFCVMEDKAGIGINNPQHLDVNGNIRVGVGGTGENAIFLEEPSTTT